MGTTPFNNLSTANRGSLLKIDVFNDKEELLSRIASVCPHDGSFSSNSGYYASNNGYRAGYTSPDFSYRDSCVSYDAGYRSSFYSTDNSYRVHNHSFGRNSCEGDKSYRGRGGG